MNSTIERQPAVPHDSSEILDSPIDADREVMIGGLTRVVSSRERAVEGPSLNPWGESSNGLFDGVGFGVSPGLPMPKKIEAKDTTTAEQQAPEPEAENAILGKEVLRQAELTVFIDRDKILSILEKYKIGGVAESIDDDLKEFFEGFAGGLKKKSSELTNKVSEVREMLEGLARLPERLDFKPGVILVAGENGKGKTTLNRAIELAMLARRGFDVRRREDRSFEEFADELLNPDDFGITINGSESVPSFISVELARCLRVEYASSTPIEYLDTTVLNAFHGGGGGYRDERTGRVRISTDLMRAGSHSQTNSGIYERIRDNLEDHRGRPRGAGIFFLDEPENGLSPQNLRKLPARLRGALGDSGSMMLVASNSERLYFDATQERIDVAHPELGVHRPIDHPEVYDLEDFDN